MTETLEQKAKLRIEPLDVIYNPLPKFARKSFANFVLDLHSASSTLTDAYEGVKAWIYRTCSGIYMAG